MKRLIIHIGTHKTATSAIQKTLTAERDRLIGESILYGSTDRPPRAHLTKHTSLYSALKTSPAAFAAEKSAIMREFDASGCDTLVMSEEGLASPRYEEFEKMRAFTEDFDEITVICLFRRPDLFLEGLWNQHCKQGTRRGRRNIQLYSQDEFTLGRLEYCTILDFWAGFAEVKAVSFDTARAGGVARTFGELAGIPLDMEAPSANVSPGANCASILAALNRSGGKFPKKRIIRAFSGDREKLALGARRRAEILEMVAPELEALERKYGVSFDMTLPEEPSIPMIRPDPDAVAAAMLFMATTPPKRKQKAAKAKARKAAKREAGKKKTGT